MSKWIEFKEVLVKRGITKLFLVVPKEDQSTYIGKVRWHRAWMKYSFFPEPDCVFETQCLKDIISFIDNLMLERKLERQKI